MHREEVGPITRTVIGIDGCDMSNRSLSKAVLATPELVFWINAARDTARKSGSTPDQLLANVENGNPLSDGARIALIGCFAQIIEGNCKTYPRE